MNHERPGAATCLSPDQEGTSAEELAYRPRQQELLAGFGRLALEAQAFTSLLQEATRFCAEGMRTRFCKAMEHLDDENEFVVRAGVGWKPDVIGSRTGADLDSPTGYAFHNGEPVISSHLESEGRFRTPQVLVEHGIRRAINVPIGTATRRYGVLEVDSPIESCFTEADIAFMQGFANLLSENHPMIPRSGLALCRSTPSSPRSRQQHPNPHVFLPQQVSETVKAGSGKQIRSLDDPPQFLPKLWSF
jgi:hypothetical protein